MYVCRYVWTCGYVGYVYKCSIVHTSIYARYNHCDHCWPTPKNDTVTPSLFVCKRTYASVCAHLVARNAYDNAYNIYIQYIYTNYLFIMLCRLGGEQCHSSWNLLLGIQALHALQRILWCWGSIEVSAGSYPGTRIHTYIAETLAKLGRNQFRGNVTHQKQ